jgi:hypothetical protein
MNPNDLTERYAKQIKGVRPCFDRLVLFGPYKAIGRPGAMGQHLQARGLRLPDYEKTYANGLRPEVAQRVKAVATEEGLAVIQVNLGQRKEALVEQIPARREGLVCILGAMERCRCYKVGKNHDPGFLQLPWSPGKCQHFYVYFIDARFGLGIPTWAPFRLQAYCNGHDWLERRLKAAGLSFRKADNCFTHLGDFAAAQALVGRFDPTGLHTMLDRLARRFVAVHDRCGASLHGSVYQAEWATDIVFKDDRLLPELYARIVRTAAVEAGCADICRFPGKRPARRSSAEVGSRLQTFVQGARIKHTVGSTSLKMYDKAGRVLRIERATSDITSFTHYRKAEPGPRGPGRKQTCPDAQDPLQPARPGRGDAGVQPTPPRLHQPVAGPHRRTPRAAHRDRVGARREGPLPPGRELSSTTRTCASCRPCCAGSIRSAAGATAPSKRTCPAGNPPRSAARGGASAPSACAKPSPAPANTT